MFESHRDRIADRSPNRRDRFDCFCANVYGRKINDLKKRERADAAGSFQFFLNCCRALLILTLLVPSLFSRKSASQQALKESLSIVLIVSRYVREKNTEIVLRFN